MKALDKDKKRNLAYHLRADLDNDALIRYIEENRRMVENEKSHDRSTIKYQRFVDAGILAMLLPKKDLK